MASPSTTELTLAGPAGPLEAALSRPSGAPRVRALVAHPHPLYGGTMDNPVVRETAGAFVRAGGESLRFNFRGVGASAGRHDHGDGEVGDLAAAWATIGEREPALPTVLAGYSFGAAMSLAMLTAAEGAPSPRPVGVLLVAPPLTHYDFSALETWPAPIAMVYGGADELTPSRLLAGCFGGRSGERTLKRCVEGAGHDLGASLERAILRRTLDESVAWLLERAS